MAYRTRLAASVPSGTLWDVEWADRFRRWLGVIAEERPDAEGSDAYIAARIGLNRATVNKVRNQAKKGGKGDLRVSTLEGMALHMGLELPQLIWAVWKGQAPPPRADLTELP